MAHSIKIDARRILGHAATGRVMAAPVEPVGGVKPVGVIKPAGTIKPTAPAGRE